MCVCARARVSEHERACDFRACACGCVCGRVGVGWGYGCVLIYSTDIWFGIVHASRCRMLQ